MAKKRIKIDKIEKRRNIENMTGVKKNIFTRSWVFLAVVLVVIVLAVIIVPNLNKVQLSPPTCALTKYISTDYDKDGYHAACNSNGAGNDNCPTIYNPDQNNKYCNPFYGKTLTDDIDKDFIPQSPTYSSILGFYISDVRTNVWDNIKGKPVRIQTSLTGTFVERILTSAEIAKLAKQGTSPTPSPSPTGSASPSPSATP